MALAKTLLPCASAVAKRLQVGEADIPVEGYYADRDDLSRYFRLMRALQRVDEDDALTAKGMPELELLFDVTSSRMYGCAERAGKLLPKGRDPLSRALAKVPVDDWLVASLVDAAYRAATDDDDASLVGLAARAKDPVVMTALRESVVLYAEDLVAIGEDDESQAVQFRYVWRVDEEIRQCANRFIDIFNSMVTAANAKLPVAAIVEDGFRRSAARAIPQARLENAEYFYLRCEENAMVGRCVRLGERPDDGRKYHWAIRRRGAALEVDEFWSAELWTTERYRRDRAADCRGDLRYAGEAKPPVLPGLGTIGKAPREASPVNTAEVKLQLAEVYREIGDVQGAREILAEVLREGDPAQQERAHAMISRLRLA